MDDFSSELFNSFFDDHLLERPLMADRPSLLHMDTDMESSPGNNATVTIKGLSRYLKLVCVRVIKRPLWVKIFRKVSRILSPWSVLLSPKPNCCIKDVWPWNASRVPKIPIFSTLLWMVPFKWPLDSLGNLQQPVVPRLGGKRPRTHHWIDSESQNTRTDCINRWHQPWPPQAVRFHHKSPFLLPEP